MFQSISLTFSCRQWFSHTAEWFLTVTSSSVVNMKNVICIGEKKDNRSTCAVAAPCQIRLPYQFGISKALKVKTLLTRINTQLILFKHFLCKQLTWRNYSNESCPRFGNWMTNGSELYSWTRIIWIFMYIKSCKDLYHTNMDKGSAFLKAKYHLS